MKKILPYVLAFFAALAAAALLWALRLRCPAPLTDVLSPVYGSPWELGKAAFFPLLCAAPLLWGLQRGGSRGGEVPPGRKNRYRREIPNGISYLC